LLHDFRPSPLHSGEQSWCATVADPQPHDRHRLEAQMRWRLRTPSTARRLAISPGERRFYTLGWSVRGIGSGNS
jgi:hypothetical protein